MELVKSEYPVSDLNDFVDFLFDGLQGYAYLVMQEPGNKESWVTQFFQWPEQKPELLHYINVGTELYEVYLAPALYKTTENAQKPNVKCSNVVWTEFDGNAPEKWENYEPSLRIRSSSEGHEHVYWKLSTPLNSPEEIEGYTHRIAYNLQADASGWDATQVLRPPGTKNHKRQLPTYIHSVSGYIYDASVFDSLAPAPPPLETSQWELGELPTVSSVLLKYAFTTELVKLFEAETIPEGKRSSALMQFAFGACELGLKDVEVFVLLKMLDDRWGKFKGRRDRDKRLAGIITYARNKYPDTSDDDSIEQPILAFDYLSFMASELEIDWVVDSMLMESGSLLLVGPSGIGKTQLKLELMKHIALGKDFLHYKIPVPKKMLFLSLEMGHAELKKFLEAQQAVLTPDECALLGENLNIIPHGEAWPLNQPLGQDHLKQFIEALEPEGLFVDSVGSAVVGNINSQEVVQTYLNFVDHIRKKYSLFYGAIHHTRKPAPGQQGRSQDDVYGDQYLVNRASSVYAVLHGKDNSIKLDNWKLRMAEREKPYYVRRTENLTFEKVDIADGTIEENVETPKNEDGTTSDKAGGFGL